MGKVVEFYYDIACPFAYIASLRIEEIAARNQATIIWKPVLLGGIYHATKAPQGKEGSASDVMPVSKKILTNQDLQRTIQKFKIPLNWHPKHPVRSLSAMRLLSITPKEKIAELTHKLYAAYWVQNENVADPQVLINISKQVGLNIDESVFERDDAKSILRKNTDEAVERGAPGVPCFYVDYKLFWGQDRLHFVDKALGNQNAKLFRAISSPPKEKVKRLLTFYYDFSSPWSYIGATQLERIVSQAHASVTIELVPILLGALFRDIGTPNVPMLAISEARRQYGAKDMQDWIEWWGNLTLNFPSNFPLRTVLPLRVSIVEPKTMQIIYKAGWVDDKNIGDEEILSEVLNSAGYNGKALIEAANSEKIKTQLKENTEKAIKNGVCGVPSFQIDNGDIIWGQDRYDVVLDLLEGWNPSHQSKL